MYMEDRYIVGIIITVIETPLLHKPNFLSFCCFLISFLPSSPITESPGLLERGKYSRVLIGYLTMVGDWFEFNDIKCKSQGSCQDTLSGKSAKGACTNLKNKLQEK